MTSIKREFLCAITRTAAIIVFIIHAMVERLFKVRQFSNAKTAFLRASKTCMA